MKFYEKYFASNYDELITYYPRFYRDVYEMTEILKAHGRVADELETNIEQTFLNAFADYADAETLTKLEEFFHITYDGPRALASRRNMIKATLLGQKHVGQTEIKELISVFTDGEIDMELIDGAIRITVTRDYGDNFNLYDCHSVLDSRIPAHLALEMVDKTLPVSVSTDNRFVFENFKITLAVKNRSSIAEGIRLDGEKALDGTWKLDSVSPGIPLINVRVAAVITKRGSVYSPKTLDFSVYNLSNEFGLTARPQFSVGAKQQGAFRQGTSKVAGLSAKQPLGFSGSVVMDGRWTLNGDYILNGSRSLNQIYSEEDL